MKRPENKYILWVALIVLFIGAKIYKYSHLGFAKTLMIISLLSLTLLAYVGVFKLVMKHVFGAKEVSILSMLDRCAPKPVGTVRATIIAAVVVIFFFWLVSDLVRTALNALSFTPQ